jgi:hypothetical protein
MKTSNEKQTTCAKRTEPLKPGLQVRTALKAGIGSIEDKSKLAEYTNP